MDRNVNYTLVGLFVAAGVAGIIGFTAWIAGSQDTRDLARYTVYFTRGVNGLENGSTVRYRGVNVGQVTGIRFESSQPELIKVDIEIDNRTPVDTGTIAALRPLGITGQSYIGLKTDGEKTGAPPTRQGDRYPVIHAQLSELDRVFDEAPRLTSSLLGLATRMDTILEKFDRVLDEANLTHINRVVANIDAVSERVTSLLDDDAMEAFHSTLRSSRTVSANLEGLTAGMSVTLGKIDRIADSVVANEATLQRFSGEGLIGVMQLVEEARNATASINHLAASLQERPSRLIFQPAYDGVHIEQ